MMFAFLLLMMISNSMLFTYIEPIVKNGGHSLYIVSTALFLAGVAGVFGSKLGNILSEYVGYFWSGTIIVFAYIFSLLILLVFSENVILLLLSIGVWNLFHWGTNPTVQFSILQFIQGDPSQIFSYNLSILNLGIGVGSFIGGILVSIDSNYQLSLWTAILLAIVSLFFLYPTKKYTVDSEQK